MRRWQRGGGWRQRQGIGKKRWLLQSLLWLSRLKKETLGLVLVVLHRVYGGDHGGGEGEAWLQMDVNE